MNYEIRHGDSLALLREMPDASVDAIVTDPPYALGFMGKTWDSSLPGVEFWTEALRVAKPGAHLVAFGGSRTYHRLACAIEDAGWEVRDCLMWIYGSGFPKSLDVSKAIDKHNGDERPVHGMRRVIPGVAFTQSSPAANGKTEVPVTSAASAASAAWDGWGTALKPAYEPIILARKPLSGTVAANVLEHGTGALNIDGCRVEFLGAEDRDSAFPGGKTTSHGSGSLAGPGSAQEVERSTFQAERNAIGRWPANVLLDEWHDQVLRLKCNVETSVARVIGLYYGHLFDVREADAHIPEPEDAKEVLWSQVLRSGTEAEDGSVGPEIREAAHARVESEERCFTHRPGKGGGSCGKLEGREAYLARVRDGVGNAALGERPQLGTSDAEPIQRPLRPGAPTGDGEAPEEGAAASGGCASSQRDQDGQPPAKPGTVGQRDSQAGARSDSPRAAQVEVRERALEIRASEVPDGWLRYFEPTGRVVRCGSAAALDEQSGELGVSSGTEVAGNAHPNGIYHERQKAGRGQIGKGDRGGASRFFYTAKASAGERHYAGRNGHPTVKPVDLMRWLCRLVTPRGGLVLDPFTGSGSTGVAALAEGFRFLGMEREADYCAMARRRIAGPLFADLE